MAKKGGLGSGLGALFGEEYAAPQAGRDASTLPISKVEPRKDQPRSFFDEDALAELTESIRQHGLIQPITVREIDNGYYQIIAGERRWRAARAAGLTEVPVRIIEADDKRAMELALVENLQREDLNPLEEARGYRTLMEEYGMTQEDAAAAVGKSRPAVANALRLLNLAPHVLDMVERGELSAGHGRALAGIRDEASQILLANEAAYKQMSVRELELRCNRSNRPGREMSETRAAAVNYTRELELELENLLGRKVSLVGANRPRGHIELEFYGAEDREKLIEDLRLFASLRRK